MVKKNTRYLLKLPVVISLFLLIIFHNNAVSGTLDAASLSPASATVKTRTYQTVTFSATNDKTFSIKTYHAEFKYTAGLTVSASSPDTNITMQINTKRNLIILEWSSIAPGHNLNASITVYTYNAGTYTIAPSNIYYYDYTARKAYTASCNSADIIYKVNITPPPMPQNIRSMLGAGSITVAWDNPSFNYATVNTVYRRTALSAYAAIASNVGSPYTDTAVVDGATYYYKVMADDTFGNISGFSDETGETYRVLTQNGFYPVQPTAAAVGDINGDGKPDLIFGGIPYKQGHAVSGTKVDIYFGGNTTGVPDVTLYGESSPGGGGDGGFGSSLAVTDLNKDGYDDIVVGAPQYNINSAQELIHYGGRVYVYSGGPQIAATSVFTVTGKDSYGCDTTGCGYYLYIAENLGYSVAAAGDVNGDGYQDAVIGAPYGGYTQSGRILILFGSQNLSALGSTELSGQHAFEYMGSSVASSGDVNKDGYSDIIAGAPSYDNTYSMGYTNNSYGSAYLFTGGPSGIRQSAVFSTGVQKDGFGIKVSSAGDRNGDGYADMAAAAKSGPVRIYHGGASVSATPETVLTQSPSGMTPLGDINKDGYSDFLMDGPSALFGSNVGDNLIDIRRTGRTVLASADLDGDGQKEIITKDSGGVYIESLAPYLDMPEITLTSPHDNSYTMNSNLTVTGSVQGIITKLLVKNQAATVNSDGTFTASVALTEGTNTFEIIAETPAGTLSKRILTATYSKPAALTLSITSPSNDSTVNTTNVTVSGTVSDSTAAVTVNGIQAVVSNGTFTATLNLQEGANTITASATDLYGQTASVSVSVTLITKGNITGTVTDASTLAPLAGTAVTIKDSAGNVLTTSADSGGTYTISGVTQGNFTATFEKVGYIKQTTGGTLTAGQTLTLNIQLATIPPLSFSITTPANGSVFNATPITVTGSVTNNAGVTVNGIQATVSSNTFSAAISLSEGQNTITVTAVDQYGQTASASVSVTLTTKGTVSGAVTDATTGLTLSQAAVSITDSLNITQTASTDINGSYAITGIASGSFTGAITKAGYTAYTFSGSMTAGQTITISAALSPSYPTISNISINSITANSAVITWTTDQQTTTTLEYGKTAFYGNTVTDTTLLTSHSITLTSLTSGTTYHFKITATDAYNHTTTSGDQTFATTTPPSPITLTIASPIDGQTVSNTEILVKGTITNIAGNETGITVNDIIAHVFGNEFAANHVPLSEGANTITVTATDTAGNKTTASVTVNAITTTNSIKITANIESGTVPLEVTLSVSGYAGGTTPSLSYLGPASVDWTNCTSYDACKVKIATEGIYSFTATGTASDGNTYQDTIAVTVLSKTEMDALLKGKWEGMKTKLASGDVLTALSYIFSGSQASYQTMFSVLSAQLSSIIATERGFNLINITDNVARYKLLTLENGKTYSYEVLFIKDTDGLWRIKEF